MLQSKHKLIKKQFFFITIITDLIVNIFNFFNPMQRWSQLRVGAMEMKSIIWKHRAKMYTNTEILQCNIPAKILQENIKNWMDNYSDLQVTLFGKKNNDHDNNCTPVSPQLYLSERVDKSINFYESMIKGYYWRLIGLKIIMTIFSVLGIVLAFMEMEKKIIVTSAVTTAIGSWYEFSGYKHKMLRCSNTIKDLKDIKNQLIVVLQCGDQKIPPQTFLDFVDICEDILSNDILNWKAVTHKQ